MPTHYNYHDVGARLDTFDAPHNRQQANTHRDQQNDQPYSSRGRGRGTGFKSNTTSQPSTQNRGRGSGNAGSRGSTCSSWGRGACGRGSHCRFSHDTGSGEPPYVPPSGVKQGCDPSRWPDGVCRRKGCYLSHGGAGQARHDPFNDYSFTVELSEKAKDALVSKQHSALQKIHQRHQVDERQTFRPPPSPPQHTESSTVVAIDHHCTRNHDDAFSCFQTDDDHTVLCVFIANVEQMAAPGSPWWRGAQEAGANLYALPHTKGRRHLFNMDFLEACRLSEDVPNPALVMRLCVPDGLSFEDLDIDEHVSFSYECVKITDKLEYLDADGVLKDCACRDHAASSVNKVTVAEDAKEALENAYYLMCSMFPDIRVDSWIPSLRPSLQINTDLTITLEYSDPLSPSEFIIKKLKHIYDEVATKFCLKRLINETHLIVHHADIDERDYDIFAERLGKDFQDVEKKYHAFDATLRQLTNGFVSFGDVIRVLKSDRFTWRSLSPQDDSLVSQAFNPVRAHFTKPMREFVSLYNQRTLMSAINVDVSHLPPKLSTNEERTLHTTLCNVWHPLHSARYIVEALCSKDARFIDPHAKKKAVCIHFTAIRVASGYLALMPMDFGNISKLADDDGTTEIGDVVTAVAYPTKNGQWHFSHAKKTDALPPTWSQGFHLL